MHRTTPKRHVLTLVAVAVVLLAGCGGSSGSDGGGRHRIAIKQQGVGPQIQPQHAKRHRTPQPKAKPTPPDYASLCPPRSRTLAGVYHPSRLQVLDPCRRVTGTVATVRAEEDGDVHLGIDLDGEYRGMLMPANRAEQSGNLVVELMPRDHGHLTQPGVGDRVVVIGAYVDDTEHSWSEIHPVFGLVQNGGALERSGPQYGGSPPSALSESALATCRTNTGTRCTGYGGVTASASSTSGREAEPSPEPSGGDCDPNYAGACLDPNAPDYDCAGGGGDGPKYVSRVRVVGTDHYDLDSDGDGIGCE